MAGVAFVLVACILWGIDPLFRFPLMAEGVAPWVIVLVEHLILSLCFMWILPRLWRRWRQHKSELGLFILIGVGSSAIATLAFTWSFQYLNPTLVVVLQKLKTFVGLALASVWLKENMTWHFYLWVTIAVLGSVLLMANDLLQYFQSATTSSASIMLGYLLVGLAVVGWGSSTVLAKRLTQLNYSSTEIMCGRFTLGTLCFIPLWLVNPQAVSSVSGLQFMQISAMTGLSGLAAVYCLYLGLRRLNASVTSALELLTAVFAVSFSWVFLEKPLDTIQVIGTLLICLACYMAVSLPRTRTKRTRDGVQVTA